MITVLLQSLVPSSSTIAPQSVNPETTKNLPEGISNTTAKGFSPRARCITLSSFTRTRAAPFDNHSVGHTIREADILGNGDACHQEGEDRMKAATTVVILATLLLSLCTVVHAYSSVEGIWEGSLELPGLQLRVVFHISEEPDGTFSATMDSPDQGAMGIPIDEVTIEDAYIRLELKSAFAVFEGVISQDFSTIEGEWKQAGSSLPLELRHVEKATETRRPQDPEEPYPYEEEEVTYENREAGVILAGTLTYPNSGGPFPVVLLISGSGPQDRNETVLGHRPFLVLSDYLTRRGLAVLRVDDRGVGKSTGDWMQATTEDLSRDVLAGIEFLKDREEIDPTRIGLIGHSEGGIIAPMVAAQSEDVSFIVLMAGTGLPGEEILNMQAELIARAESAPEEAIAKSLERQRGIIAIVKEEKDHEVRKDKLRAIILESLEELPEEQKGALPDPEVYVEAQLVNLLSPWFEYFLTYDPKLALTRVQCSVLAIIGEKDLQVPPKENLSAIREALQQGGNEDYTLLELPGLNHLFQSAETGALSEYAKIEETISPTALETIGDWILERTG